MSKSLDFQSQSDNKYLFPSGNILLEELGLDSNLVKTINPRFKRVNYKVVVTWLTKKYQHKDDSNLEKVRPLLEAFYHLCEVEEWEKSGKILLIPIKNSNNDELHIQLEIWGYYRETIELYQQLLNKLTVNQEMTFSRGLGNAYLWLSDYEKALNYHLKSLELAEKFGDSASEGMALGNIGNIYSFLGQYETALNYYRKNLVIARKIKNKLAELAALGNLGYIYNLLEYHTQAIEYHQDFITIAHQMGELSKERIGLNNLGVAYKVLQDYQKATDCYQKALDIAYKIGSRAGIIRSLGNLGNLYFILGDYLKAYHYQQEALSISRNLEDHHLIGKLLDVLGEILMKLNKYPEALTSLREAIAIFKKISSSVSEARALLNLSELYYQIDNIELANDYCNQALIMSTEKSPPLARDCHKLKEKLINYR